MDTAIGARVSWCFVRSIMSRSPDLGIMFPWMRTGACGGLLQGWGLSNFSHKCLGCVLMRMTLTGWLLKGYMRFEHLQRGKDLEACILPRKEGLWGGMNTFQWEGKASPMLHCLLWHPILYKGYYTNAMYITLKKIKVNKPNNE